MNDGTEPPILLFIVGPPAVGKMAVGHEVARRTGMRLLHNHMTIEPILPIFDFGTPAFFRLVGGLRQRIVEEVAHSDLPGLIFTFVWAFDHPEEEEELNRHAQPFRERGGRVLYVELEATLEERLRRNETELRLREKASKRDLEASRRRLLADEERYRLNSNGEFDGRADYLRIDNTKLSAVGAAETLIAHFGLPETEGP